MKFALIQSYSYLQFSKLCLLMLFKPRATLPTFDKNIESLRLQISNILALPKKTLESIEF